MSLYRISMAQALSVWSDLEAAIRGEHGYGGHVAEIYVYRLQSRNPSAEAKVKEAEMESLRTANEALHDLLVHFAKERDARITVEIYERKKWTFIELGDWLRLYNQEHRWHIHVEPKG